MLFHVLGSCLAGFTPLCLTVCPLTVFGILGKPNRVNIAWPENSNKVHSMQTAWSSRPYRPAAGSFLCQTLDLLLLVGKDGAQVSSLHLAPLLKRHDSQQVTMLINTAFDKASLRKTFVVSAKKKHLPTFQGDFLREQSKSSWHQNLSEDGCYPRDRQAASLTKESTRSWSYGPTRSTTPEPGSTRHDGIDQFFSEGTFNIAEILMENNHEDSLSSLDRRVVMQEQLPVRYCRNVHSTPQRIQIKTC